MAPIHIMRHLPVFGWVHFKILLYVFKCLHGLAHSYLFELLHLYSPPRSLRSADLQVPRRRLRGDRAFSVAAPQLWNNLPLNVRISPSLSIFKTSLKTQFLLSGFEPRQVLCVFELQYVTLMPVCFWYFSKMYSTMISTGVVLKCFINKVGMAFGGTEEGWSFFSTSITTFYR